MVDLQLVPIILKNQPEIEYYKRSSKESPASLHFSLGQGLLEIWWRYYYAGKEKNLIFFKLNSEILKISQKCESIKNFFEYFIDWVKYADSLKKIYDIAKVNLPQMFESVDSHIKYFLKIENYDSDRLSADDQIQAFANIFRLIIVFNDNDLRIKEFQPLERGLFPVLYLLYHESGYFLLYTKTMYEIESNENAILQEIVFGNDFIRKNLTVYNKSPYVAKNILDPVEFFKRKSMQWSEPHKPSERKHRYSEIPNRFRNTCRDCNSVELDQEYFCPSKCMLCINCKLKNLENCLICFGNYTTNTSDLLRALTS